MIRALRRSFRGKLAIRFGLAVLMAASIGSTTGYLVLRNLLLDQIDSTLLRLASIEASGAAASGDSTVNFHDDLFLTAGPGTETVFKHFAQIWSIEGAPVLRTRNLGGRDLPLSQVLRYRVVNSGEPELFDTRWESEPYRGILYPLGLVGPQHELHLLEVIVSAGRAYDVLADFRNLLVLLAIVGTVATALLGWWLAGAAVRPVLETIRQAESIEMTGGDHRIEAEAETAELERLVSVLNSMLARIDAAFEAQRRFIADVGHEIRTPLTVLRGDVEVALRRRRSQEEYEAILEQSLEDLKAVSTLADDLITLARGESGALTPVRRPVRVDDVLEKVAERYRRSASAAGAEIELKAEPLVVPADGRLLSRAIGNLVDNAIKYAASGGIITLSAERGDGSAAVITVSDRGPGIPANERDRLFHRFVRGEAGHSAWPGSGLGLSIVKAIVESHGGTISLRSTAGTTGTTFELRFPMSAKLDLPGAKESDDSDDEEGPAGNGRDAAPTETASTS